MDRERAWDIRASQARGAEDNVHLIVAEDEEVVIEHHPEDWMAFADVLGARLHRLPAVLHPLRPQRQPGLDRGDRALRPDVVMFIGGAMVTRRNTHIAVELLSNVMAGPAARGAAGASSISSRSAFSACSPTSR